MARRCVRSRNLENEEAKARYWAVKIQPQWVVTPGKQCGSNLVFKMLMTCYVFGQTDPRGSCLSDPDRHFDHFQYQRRTERGVLGIFFFIKRFFIDYRYRTYSTILKHAV